MRIVPRLLTSLTLGVFLLAGSAAPGRAGERLLVPSLSGWKTVTSRNDPAVEVTELIPSEQTEDNWSDRLTIQAFRKTPMGVAEVLDGLRPHTAEVCDDVALGPIDSLAVPGAVAAGRRWIACSRYKGDGQGSYTVFSAVRGRDALFLVARAWRGQPFPVSHPPVSTAEVAQWNALLGGLRLCEDGSGSQPAPGTEACPSF